MTTAFGMTSNLDILIDSKEGKSFIKDLYFNAPFKIARPFELDDGSIKIILMSSSAGIMEGDIQDINISLLENSKLEMSTQSFEKIHKMHNKQAQRNCSINISKNAYLKYLPLPTIPFAKSAFETSINVNLADKTSKFVMTDIVTCGRYKRGEKFKYKYYKSLINVIQQGELLYRDNTVLYPEKFPVDKFGMFEKYTHLANILFFNFNLNEDKLDNIREILNETKLVDGGCSFTWNNDVIVRVFGLDAQSLLEVSKKIIGLAEE